MGHKFKTQLSVGTKGQGKEARLFQGIYVTALLVSRTTIFSFLKLRMMKLNEIIQAQPWE